MTEAASPGSAAPDIRAAATVLLLRDQPAFEVLMVKRHHQIDNASGALVFPGGKSSAGDHDPAWADHASGWEAHEPEQRALRIAAIREVFEEAGLLLARRRDGAPFDEAACAMATRQAVDSGAAAFLDVVRELDARLDLGALTIFARWITPLGAPRRFDTWFYVVTAPPDQLAVCDGRETVDAEWIAPGEALRLSEAGERKVVFPTRMNLRRLAEACDARDAVARAAARPLIAVRPRMVDRDGGRMLVLSPEFGYGDVEESIEKSM
jgi:8-oxo-dGTP pyrophosphatase MutT (NUDIX family)